MKQLRFTSLVQAAGRPHAATLWTDPKNDPEFKKAIAENRVVTIRTPNVGTKKEKGEIGFTPGPASTYLIFPKALPMKAGHPVIGIKFDLIEEPAVKDPVKVKPAARKSKIQAVKIRPDERPQEEDAEEQPRDEKIIPLPRPKTSKGSTKTEHATFIVTVQSTASVTREVEVQAPNASAALAAAEAQAARLKLPKPDWSHEALEVKKASG